MENGVEGQASGSQKGVYTQRELYFQQQEAQGAFKISHVVNDGQHNHSLWLVALKNIFSRQLPNMPKEYITRLVFDRRHRSVAIIRKDGSVVGGITYRPFHEQGFGEIAFCAVSSGDQVKGFGSRLMSYTKEFAKRKDSLTHFLTFADNNAVTFFAKQGFTNEVTMATDMWVGYIKDYDGGTLMESILHEEVDYTQFPQMIHVQRSALIAKTREHSLAHLIYPSITTWNDPGFETMHASDIPGVIDAGWSTRDVVPSYSLLVEGCLQTPSPHAVAAVAGPALAALRAHEDSPAFQKPVCSEEVPDYYDVVKDPIDLTKVEERLKSKKYYTTLEIFQADVNRIFKNAHIYNAADTYWYKAASRLQDFFKTLMASYVVSII